MAASGHFEFCALPRVAQTFKRGVAAYFVTNTLKYQKQASNFVTRGGLVTEFMILPLLHIITDFQGLIRVYGINTVFPALFMVSV